MKKLIVFLTLLGFSFWGSSVLAGNTVTRFENVIEISAMDSDWSWSSIVSHPKGIKILAIKFFPGAAEDYVVIRNGSDTGPKITKIESQDGEPRVDLSLSGSYFKPVIDFGDCSLTAGASVVIISPK